MVSVRLANGQRLENVVVVQSSIVAEAAGKSEIGFDPAEIVEITLGDRS